MNSTLLIAIILITAALFWYSLAVWAERLAGILRYWHVVLFWTGFVFDASGTLTMGILSKNYLFDIHGITGPLALSLMLFHASWASVVIARKNEERIRTFHRFSLLVWMVWLIPYFTGLILHMK